MNMLMIAIFNSVSFFVDRPILKRDNEELNSQL
jgi:hypothetical protein